MKKTMLSLLFLCSTLIAEVTNIEVTPELIEENKIKIIDIRTQREWEEMGIISGAHLITFFTKNNKHYGDTFLKELNMLVEKDEQFAIISNTASRTKLVSNFLGNKHNYNVINLIGGMSKLLEEGYEVEVYNPNEKSDEVENSEMNSTTE
jgi:rhodanese-related sulfurtransferase